MEENKMGTMPANKLLVTMSLPLMVSMLVQAFYNVVDSIFVARICEDALTAVSMAFSMQNLMISVGAGTGVGINALLSKSLGEKKQEQANLTAGNSIVLGVLSYFVFLILGLTISEAYFKWQTSSSAIIEYGREYLSICLIGSIGLFLSFTFERLLSSTGRTFYSMLTQITGGIINIILDPIMIFGLAGFPKLGVRGAAYATIIGQICGCLMGAVLNFKRNHEITFAPKYFKLSGNIVKRIYAVGFPSIIVSSISSVTVFCLNKIVIKFTSTAVAVLGIFLKLQSFTFMPIFGMNNAMIPIVAYNYGAKNKQRINKTMWLTVLYSTILMLIGFLMMFIIPDKLLAMFDASDNMIKIGVPALKIISTSYIFAGFNIAACSVFQALSNGLYSLIVSATRQIVVLVPVAFALATTGVLEYVWLSYPIAEIASLIISSLMLKKTMKRLNF